MLHWFCRRKKFLCFIRYDIAKIENIYFSLFTIKKNPSGEKNQRIVFLDSWCSSEEKNIEKSFLNPNVLT